MNGELPPILCDAIDAITNSLGTTLQDSCGQIAKACVSSIPGATNGAYLVTVISTTGSVIYTIKAVVKTGQVFSEILGCCKGSQEKHVFNKVDAQVQEDVQQRKPKYKICADALDHAASVTKNIFIAVIWGGIAYAASQVPSLMSSAVCPAIESVCSNLTIADVC